MAMTPISPDTHPSRIQLHMQAFRQDIHSAVEAARNETDPQKALEHVKALAEQVEYLGSVIHALTNAAAWRR